MDRFAGLVCRVLGVPTALVCLVEPNRQFFPGAAGLAEPWQSLRAAPLPHSPCQYVVRSGRPLALRDARLDERTGQRPGIETLGVVGYAGMPLADAEGHVFGALCAIDDAPRAWSSQAIETLRDLANYPVYPVDSPWPGARAIRENRMVVSQRPGRDFGPEAETAYDRVGLRTIVCVPLPGVRAAANASTSGSTPSPTCSTKAAACR
jgi:hypothetical protein